MTNYITQSMTEAIITVYTGLLTTKELTTLSTLAFQATSDEIFYEWELPILVGYTREEMQTLGAKPRELATL